LGPFNQRPFWAMNLALVTKTLLFKGTKEISYLIFKNLALFDAFIIWAF
jgi:hypothetical protein